MLNTAGLHPTVAAFIERASATDLIREAAECVAHIDDPRDRLAQQVGMLQSMLRNGYAERDHLVTAHGIAVSISQLPGSVDSVRMIVTAVAEWADKIDPDGEIEGLHWVQAELERAQAACADLQMAEPARDPPERKAYDDAIDCGTAT